MLETALWNREVPNFFANKKRRRKPVRRNPRADSRKMKARMTPRAKKAFPRTKGGDFSSGPAAGSVLDRYLFQNRTPPKKRKRTARILGNKAGPGWSLSREGKGIVRARIQIPRPTKILPEIRSFLFIAALKRREP
jgi:hypothetical protein